MLGQRSFEGHLGFLNVSAGASHKSPEYSKKKKKQNKTKPKPKKKKNKTCSKVMESHRKVMDFFVQKV